jgi:endo-1,4-beta-xylanase
MTPTRRALMQAAMATALTACSERSGHASEVRLPPAPPLKAAARFPVGTCLATPTLADPDTVGLILRHFSQITPEWEMKMERILTADGGYRFDAADAIARFCAGNGLKLHGTTLVWYAQDPVFFHRLAGDRRGFEQSYRDYIGRVVTRYRGLARGWDVVNEAVAEDGHGYRGGIWEQALGPDYARIAFETARQADPDALLFLNDYNLETNPAKLDSFQRLLEGLLRAGAPVTGIGTQTHLPADLEPGRAGAAIKALARFGLPIHVSELDVSTRRQSWLPSPADPDRLDKQARVVGEVAEAFMGLPEAQRYAFTLWGVRDRDSWLRRGPNAGDGSDQPLLFDDIGNAKPAFDTLRAAFARG